MASKKACTELIDSLTSLSFAYKRLRRIHTEQRAAVLLLGVIAKHGEIRVSDLAHELHLVTSTISRQVDQLVVDGLAERFAEQRDGRVILLRATDSGHELLTSLRDMVASDVATRLDDWADTDISSLSSLLQHLETSLSESDNGKGLSSV